MEPQSSNLEQAPKTNPEHMSNNPEVSSASEAERKLEHVPIGALEQIGGNESHERSTGSSNNGLQAAATDAAAALPGVQGSAQDATLPSDNTNPAPTVAADDDVIEKEWVNKAKKVINQTKGDPYAKEREVSKLQADYMQKRYGKQVKMPDEI